MAENKTTVTGASVSNHIAAIADGERRKDCEALVGILRKITRQEPKMWGPTIVGFGSYRYKYESGREGEWCLTGFAARKNELVKRLEDVDTSVLERLVKDSLAEIKRRFKV